MLAANASGVLAVGGVLLLQLLAWMGNFFVVWLELGSLRPHRCSHDHLTTGSAAAGELWVVALGGHRGDYRIAWLDFRRLHTKVKFRFLVSK